MYPQH